MIFYPEKNYKDVDTEARAIVCIVCLASWAVSAYVGKPLAKAELCPACGIFGGVEKFGMVTPRSSALEAPMAYIVTPPDELQQYVEAFNHAF